MSIESEEFMRAALREGRRALPLCLPNPPVGCVLVKSGAIIARGHTQPPGLHHAEAMALSQVLDDLAGVTAYVTLEPCSFQGRTPSCAKALVAIGKLFIIKARSWKLIKLVGVAKSAFLGRELFGGSFPRKRRLFPNWAGNPTRQVKHLFKRGGLRSLAQVN